MRSLFMGFLITLVTITSISAKDAVIIGIAGGTGSGKTTFAKKIQAFFPDASVVISQDSYYKDLSHISSEERKSRNFDHPDAIDFPLLRSHLISLKRREAIDSPIYLFDLHERAKIFSKIEAADLVIVEGILLFAEKSLEDLFDIKIFISTDDDIRLLRRIERDMSDRGRDFNSIKNQYLSTVKPMHDAFVEPSKRLADVIIPEGGYNEKGLGFVVAKLSQLLPE